ncbi:unnamed protein product [Paramecium primaurelia]|uniref:Uncharacterized protein n=1 Tax=Paramecium primaurelia TaxID=5886 RepID=A0A8S1M8H0_PARPR|nr:unnamed protein product [Paramecium primaurelia]
MNKKNLGWDIEEQQYLDSLIPGNLPKIEKRHAENKCHKIKSILDSKIIKCSSSIQLNQISKSTQISTQTTQTAFQNTLTSSFQSPMNLTSYQALRYPPKQDVVYKSSKKSQSPLKRRKYRCSIINLSQPSILSPQANNKLYNINKYLQQKYSCINYF